MQQCPVLIADDHAMIREGLRAMLEDVEDLEVVGEAVDGQEVISLVRKHNPRIVLMDLTMPRLSGIEAIRIIKSRHPEIKIIVLTVHKSEEFIRSTLDSGADAYVLKDDTREELLSAIRQVQRGQTFLSPGIASMVVTGFLHRSATNKQPAGKDSRQTRWDTLTKRERQTTKLIAEGYKNKEIARIMSVSLKTVEKHRSNLMRKLDLHSASAVTTYAIKNKLLCIPGFDDTPEQEQH
jgi:DNA-binding NarL/FixJ family response regulator